MWVTREALMRSPDYFRGWRIVFRVDNSCAAHYILFRYGDILSLQQLAENFEFEERRLGCWCMAVHIAGVNNVVSDRGSRDATFATRWNTDAHK